MGEKYAFESGHLIFKRAQAKRSSWGTKCLIVVLVVNLCLVTRLIQRDGLLESLNIWLKPDVTSSTHYSRWGDISPNTDLIWHPCYEKFDCAKLDLPLDWLDPSDDLRVSIAIIRFNATDRKNYKGPVFFNPGGPGGSGVFYVKQLAPYYQAVVGHNYDIISFDPRGVGNSYPQIDCWAGAKQNAQIWDMKEVDVVDSHPGTLYDAYAHASAFSTQCATVLQGGNGSRFSSNPADRKVAEAGLGRFVTTASVARDMLEIMLKIGEKKLKYWGFSYGTVLGTTFAAMYPDKVDRMVNDGNVDSVEWESGRGIHFVQDTDKVMNAFYHFCHLAGPIKCSFYALSPEEIKLRLDNLLETVRKHPVVVPAGRASGTRPEVVSFSSVRRMIASSLYRPLLLFPGLADALTELEKNNGNPFIKLSGQGTGNPILCESEPGPAPELPEVEGTADATNAISCSDIPLLNRTVDEVGEYIKDLVEISKSAGATMAHMGLACVGWSVEAKWRFTGPFSGNTSFPILFVANTGDNVTPLRSAQQNSNRFPGSVVMVLDSYGHTTLAMPSKCASKAINAYFQDGTLPPPGTICEPDFVPFDKFDTSSVQSSSADAELDAALLNLMLAPVMKF